MKIVDNRLSIDTPKIEVGDLIRYEGSILLLTYLEDVSNVEFPYVMIDISNGTYYDGFKTLNGVNEYSELICKSKDLELHLKGASHEYNKEKW